jgi:hypothetical protein
MRQWLRVTGIIAASTPVWRVGVDWDLDAAVASLREVVERSCVASSAESSSGS